MLRAVNPMEVAEHKKFRLRCAIEVHKASKNVLPFISSPYSSLCSRKESLFHIYVFEHNGNLPVAYISLCELSLYRIS